MYNTNKRIEVISMVPHTVVMSIPDYHFNYTFSREGQKARVPYDALEAYIQFPGPRLYFEEGTLKVTSKEDRIALGLEIPVEDYTEETDLNTLEVEEEIFTIGTGEMLILLKSNDAKKVEETLKKCNEAQIKEFIRTAINFKAYTGDILDVLQKYAPNNLDIDKLVALKRDVDKAEEKIKSQQA